MKKFYSFIISLLFVWSASAQSPTFVFSSSDCNFVQNFSLTNGGFSSPSIYSDDDDVSFYWVQAFSAFIETSGLTNRTGSVISPVFLNTQNGQAVTGFRYDVPAGTEYRLRIISGTIGQPLEILATTANGPVWTALPSTSGSLCLLLLDADLHVGQGLRYEISFRATVAGNMLFTNFATASQQASLPVTFRGFVARKNDNNTINLLWDVGDEINVNSYVVERSYNGSDFTSIGSVTATGKPSYNLVDNSFSDESQTRYYRVKNVDIDGQSKYTPVIRVSGRKTSNQIQLYPVPATDYVYVQHDKAPVHVSISLFNMDGRLIKQIQTVPNTFQTRINISELKSGVYIVKYDDGNGDIQSAKLIKP